LKKGKEEEEKNFGNILVPKKGLTTGSGKLSPICPGLYHFSTERNPILQTPAPGQMVPYLQEPAAYLPAYSKYLFSPGVNQNLENITWCFPSFNQPVTRGLNGRKQPVRVRL
jgi:hypothetical protein